MHKIVFDCERMKYIDTGLYHYCLNLGLNLQNYADPGIEEIIMYGPDKALNLFNAKCRFPITQHSYHKFLLPDLSKYYIWHTTYQNSSYLPRRNKKIKVVLSIHDLNFLYDSHKSDQKKERHHRHLQTNIDRSDVIICISEFCKNDVLKFCDTGNRPIYVIYNGTNSLNNPELNSSSYKPDKKFLFSIGVLGKNKNFHSLLPLLEHNNEMELLIAGKHDNAGYVNYMMDSAKKLGVEKKLHLLGAVTEEEKSWYYKNCYAFTSASLAEGFGMPVAEAMSFGKPLFLANKTALPEIGGNVAFYFQDFSPAKMREVFNDGMHLYNHTNMHEAIKKRGSSFCWEKAAKLYLEIYRSLY